MELPALATELCVGRVYVKDESSRLGLPAFTVLGASWAIARALAARAVGTAGAPGATPGSMPDWPQLRRLAGELAPLTLATATDGNHGRAVARIAALLEIDARIHVPEVITASAVAAIASEGAEVVRIAGPYDDAVRAAARAAADEPRTLLVQDTAWPGYEDVPGWIVEGYTTLFAEIDDQLRAGGVPHPTLTVVPIGVGSLAQAGVHHHRSRPDGGPHRSVLGVEPDTAPCVLESLAADELRSVATGTTVMAGLNCGTPSSIAWPVLRGGLDAVVAVDDAAACRAVTDLAALGVPAGPSGASSLAGGRAALTGSGHRERRSHLGVDEHAVVVLLSTEGPTASEPDAEVRA